LLADFWGCEPVLLDDAALIERVALAAVAATGATVLQSCAHRFEPQGVTVVVIVAESHLAIHTWPERGYLGFDYFTCGDRVDPRGALAAVREALRPTRVDSSEVARGSLAGA
jgi:S-adenosylmethionine decarboxylase